MSKYPKRFKITLPVTEVDTPEGKKPRNIGADIVRAVINQPPQGGIKPDDMRKRVPFLDRLDTCQTELYVNESERAFLLELYKDFNFGVVDRVIVQTLDNIVNAEDCTLAPVAA